MKRHTMMLRALRKACGEADVDGAASRYDRVGKDGAAERAKKRIRGCGHEQDRPVALPPALLPHLPSPRVPALPPVIRGCSRYRHVVWGANPAVPMPPVHWAPVRRISGDYSVPNCGIVSHASAAIVAHHTRGDGSQ